MAHEREVKLRVEYVKALARALKKLGAKRVSDGSGRVHEWNVIFDTPQGGLAKHGQLLRIRTETPAGRPRRGARAGRSRVLLTFKRPAELSEAASKMGDRVAGAGRHKVREEIEVEVAEAGTLTKIFEGLGMRGWFRYEKFRTTFKLPAVAHWAEGLLIEVDETPIGTYVELEGPAEAIDRAARELGFSPRDYVLKNYLALYVEQCRRNNEEPRDMVFPESR
jgi:adenylate cyclase, class 2